jgi:hypothetical protein
MLRSGRFVGIALPIRRWPCLVALARVFFSNLGQSVFTSSMTAGPSALLSSSCTVRPSGQRECLFSRHAGRQYAPRAANAFGFANKSVNESISPPNEKMRVTITFSSICTAQAAVINLGGVEVVRPGPMVSRFRSRKSAFRYGFRKHFASPHG